ncbi:MAG TPA: DUF1080 domain-containing protein [Lacipirellulaceae bacterium]|nr:DUF1080 domain-containing protein [Lacipirellulaceae bacterium]
MMPISRLLVSTATLVASFAANGRASEPVRLDDEQIFAGWISLFDGETLFGWKATSDANWRAEEGEIHVDAGEPGFLMTNGEFADYELHVEFKAPADTNSGIFIRSSLEPTDPTKDCVEINIAPPNNPFPTISLVGRQRFQLQTTTPLAAINDAGGKRFVEADQLPDPWDGEWHAFDISVNGSVVIVALDGVAPWTGSVHDFLAGVGDPRRGHIGLQFREGRVAFRNIRLRPLGLQPMLNGRDLTGWNTDHTEDGRFEMNDRGELLVRGGRGILETDASFADFIMQLDCYVDGEGLNSGVFFRSIPREFANGYESQIHNGVIDGDQTQPVDAGTGAIYRRTVARRVVSQDRQWFTKTVLATGPHIAVWVNGVHVTDWTDDRPAHDNPRNGRRLAGGTIALQAHDPTTNLRFRNLRIAELPESPPGPDQ